MNYRFRFFSFKLFPLLLIWLTIITTTNIIRPSLALTNGSNSDASSSNNSDHNGDLLNNNHNEPLLKEQEEYNHEIVNDLNGLDKPPIKENDKDPSKQIIDNKKENDSTDMTTTSSSTSTGIEDEKDHDDQEEDHTSRWAGIDTLVAIFFVIAAMWLIAATIYSIMLLILIRLQARGELDIYDENLGRLTFCNGRFSLHFGCIMRRYAIQLEQEYQRRLQQRYGEAADGGDTEEPAPIRIMTREERRKAIEELLGMPKDDAVSASNDGKLEPSCVNDIQQGKRSFLPSSPNVSIASSQEGPVCSICLAEYTANDTVFNSIACPHMYHKDCLLEWLERRNNTVSKSISS
jgi:hypothetical protein